MSEFGGLWKHENNQHELVPPKMEYGSPSGGGIKNGYMHYPSYGGTQRERERRLIALSTAQRHKLNTIPKQKLKKEQIKNNKKNLKEKQIKVEYNAKHAHYIDIKHNKKVSPFGIALVKKKKAIQLGDAGTSDRFGLAFEYQIKKYIKKNRQKQSQIKNTT